MSGKTCKLPILHVIFMASLQQGAVPKDWRSANAVPVFKKGINRLSAENYRPISLTSICSKVLEHIIYKHIMAHCEKRNILVDYQHGFRKSRSCETQLITVPLQYFSIIYQPTGPQRLSNITRSLRHFASISSQSV